MRTAHVVPSATAAARAALSDCFFNSLRLVSVNALWGVWVVLVLVALLVAPGLGVVLLPIAGLGVHATFAMATQIVRGERGLSFRDAIRATRARAAEVLLLSIAAAVTTVILAANLLAGLGGTEPLGWALATLAAWGLTVGWVWLLVAWVVLADPVHASDSLGACLGIAWLVIVREPRRFAGLGFVAAVIAAVSAILTVTLISIGLAYIALVVARVVCPSTDVLRPEGAPA